MKPGQQLAAVLAEGAIRQKRENAEKVIAYCIRRNREERIRRLDGLFRRWGFPSPLWDVD